MALFKITYARISYENKRHSQTVPLGSILTGELNYTRNINRLDRFGKSKGIDTLTMGDEMLSIETHEFSVKEVFDYEAMREVKRANWEFVSAESI